MGRKKNEGLPYLVSSLKFDWNSSTGVDDSTTKHLLAELCKCVQKSATVDEKIFVTDFQSVFDGIADQTIDTVVIDSRCIRPSAVDSALGLYFTNFEASTKTYCLPDLASSFKENDMEIEIIGLRKSNVSNSFRESSLRPLSVTTKPRKCGSTFSRSQTSLNYNETLSPAQLLRSIGKSKKKKR